MKKEITIIMGLILLLGMAYGVLGEGENALTDEACDLHEEECDNGNDRSCYIYNNFCNNVIRTSEGNVGIGTDNPESKLDVGGDILSSEKISVLSPTPTFYLSISSPNSDEVTNYGLWGNGNNDNFQIFEMSNGFEKRVTIENGTGNVGIGTTEPDSKLEVDGKVKMNDILQLEKNSSGVLPGDDGIKECNSDREGAVYYNEEISKPCFCGNDGRGNFKWRRFDGEGLCEADWEEDDDDDWW